MRALLCTLILLVFLSPAYADTVPLSITWDAPTAFTDGTPATPADIVGYVICLDIVPIPSPIPTNDCGVADTFPFPGGSTNSATISYDTAGAVMGTIYGRIFAIDQLGVPSDLSGQDTRPFVVIVAPAPGAARLGAPDNFSLQ